MDDLTTALELRKLVMHNQPDFHAACDQFEAFLSGLETTAEGDAFSEPEHIFTPGLYSRRLFMPAGSVVVSKIHKTEHQFTVLTGRVIVQSADGVHLLAAGHQGVTQPGARRILFVMEDTLWATFHPTTETDLKRIEEDLILPRHALPEFLAPSLPCPG